MAKNKKKKNSGGNGVHALSDEQFVRQRARLLPIGDCYMSEGTEESGIASIAVIRNHPQGKVTGAMFLVDFFCLGVKDAVVFVREDLEDLRERFCFFDERNDEVKKISYEEAHNRIYGAIAFAEEAGIKPCKEFNLAKYILEEDTDDIPLIEYEFGKDGKHTLFAKNGLELTTYLPILRDNLGDDFDYYCEESHNPDEDDFEENYFDDETDDDFVEFFGDGIYPSTYQSKIKGLIGLLDGENGEGTVSDVNMNKLLAYDHDTLREDIYELLWYMKGMADAEEEDEKDEEYDDEEIDDNVEPATFMIINAMAVLMQIGFGDKRYIINDWFDSSPYILNKYFGSYLNQTEMPVYTLMATTDFDYVCTLARDYGLWVTESDTNLLSALGLYLNINPDAKGTVIGTYRAILDIATESAKEDPEDKVRIATRVKRAITVAFVISLFGFKELLPNIKEACEAMLIPNEMYSEIEKMIENPKVEKLHEMMEELY